MHLVKQKIESILAVFPERGYHKVYMSGKGNFRDKIATILPYKGNRDPLHKPIHYKEIKEYLRDVQGAIVVNGKEADDAISNYQWEHPDKSTVICTIDKDLDMIPGYHYNWNKNKVYFCTLEQANRWFWMQMLTGDSADNIPGINKVGPVTANKLLNGSDNYREAVEDQYVRQYGDRWYTAFEEVARLLFLQRASDKTYKDYF